MFSSVERVVSFCANLIAVVTFGAAVLGWLDTNLVPNYTPATTSTATLIILFYAILASFGSAVILKQRTQQGEPIVIHVALFVLMFCFTLSYLQGYLTSNLSPADTTQILGKTQLASIIIYMVIHGAVHYGPIMYPRGIHVVDLFTAAFRPGFYHGLILLLIYLASLPFLIEAFSRAKPT